MAGSGRWDFQAHTHDLRTRGPVGTNRKDGSLLTGRAWNPTTGQLESDIEHEQRVSADVAAQLDDFAGQKLPKPLLFAYPFADIGPRQDRLDTARIIDSAYVAALTNNDETVAPTSRRSSAGREIQRIEVFGDTQPTDLVTRVASWTAIAPGSKSPLKDAGRWWDPSTRSVPSMDVLRGKAKPPAGKTYVQATYAPYATADWNDYRVAATVQGLDPRGGNANVTVRVGGTGSVTVRTSFNGVQVVSASGTPLSRLATKPGPKHLVEISVAANSTGVRVDNGPVKTLGTSGGPRSAGGIGIAVRNPGEAHSPSFSDLTVRASRPDPQ
jgi:poly-beta-1,6-N-acetyl-D-glucosamine N-deacetylase